MGERRGGEGLRVALVGRRLPDNENLGLGYLRAALGEAGFAAETHVLNGAADVARIGAALLARPPGLVGLSLADGGSALLPLALGELLRARGYAGHVTCGGAFATLARRWLLDRYSWLGSVVRFAGEVPLCGLAARLAAGGAAAGVPGVTTREGDGPPAPVTDESPLRLRAVRDELPRILGHGAAHIAATRGCLGRCLYCGPAAIQAQEREEGRRDGIAPEELARCGVGGVRRRRLDDVCDEMAELWRGRGVRYFYFVDEHLLPYEEREALDFLEAWRAGLRRRRVGKLGIGGMLRADRLTPAVVRSFAAAGLVRVFLGLEFATAGEAKRSGRRAPGAAELDLVRELAALGVVTVSNLMLVHPESTPETLAAGIDFLSRIPAGSFEATRMMAYQGTRLWERLGREGRLDGNPLRWGYRLDDPVVERFSRLFTRLRAEVFSDYSIGYRTHDAHLACALQQRLGRRTPAGLAERLERVRGAVNALYVEAYREALALARGGDDAASREALLRRAGVQSRRLGAELEGIEAGLLAGRPGARLLAPMRAAAAGAISFCLLAGGATCSRSPERPGGSTPQPESAVRDDGATEAGRESPRGSEGGGAEDAAAREEEAGEAEPEAAAAEAGGPEAIECTDERRAADSDALRKRVGEVDSCFSGSVRVLEATPQVLRTFADAEAERPPSGGAYRVGEDGRVYAYQFAGDSAGSGFGLRTCDADTGRRSEKRLAEALEGESYPCAGPYLDVAGGAQEEIRRMTGRVGSCGRQGGYGGMDFEIVLDGTGAVVDVRGTGDGDASEVQRCVREALRGLSFPCLADFEICPEFVIIE
ncbi:MAG: radical SAM protein [Deltaproteobacteria bacterium]|nr:radical SAM protein [Deltaproteobacteria bacterium]